jgi:predicted CoA-binding protein
MEKSVLRKNIRKFFAGPGFAVVGVSADRKKFGNIVYRTMKERGLHVVPVHPALTTVEGDPCFRTVMDLPAEVGSIVTVVPPSITEQVIEQCALRGIRVVWMQTGSESVRAIAVAESSGIAVVPRECILMYLEPVTSVHALHRWVVRLFGKYAA